MGDDDHFEDVVEELVHEQPVHEEPVHEQLAEVSSDDEGNISEYMHTPVSTDDEGNILTNPIFKEHTTYGSVQLELGMEFANLTLFKNAVINLNIYLGREIKWKKNDSKRARAICANPDCSWVVLCSWESKLHTFQIKTYVPEHSCSRSFQNRSAKRDWVAKRLEVRLVTQPELKRKQAISLMKEEFLLHLEEKKVSRALKIAREAVEGSEKKQYGQLWDYLEEIHKTNPGSIATMEVNHVPQSPPIFQRLFIAMDACVQGFRDGCRHLIGLDGCFLKGYYGGQLLSAVGQDANNQLYVIAYAVVDAETRDNWRWFLSLLEEALGAHGQYDWNFISDQQKGLETAMAEVMPRAQHRNCVVHIWKNFIKKFKDKELRSIVWEVARCTTVGEYNGAMGRLKDKHLMAWSYLKNLNPSSWVKAYYSHWPKVDNITNNMCEVWNAKITEYRDKPILTMLEELRCYVMRRMGKHKISMRSWKERLLSAQQRKLEKVKVDSFKWTPTWTGNIDLQSYEVKHRGKNLGVSLTNHTCTCQKWQLTGMPCEHAIAAIAFNNEKPEDYVHHWLTIDAYNMTYSHAINPVSSEEFWVSDNQKPRPVPPNLKRPSGRPKKHRRRDAYSEAAPNTSHKQKRSWKAKCPKCNEEGHYAKTCKGPSSKRQKKNQSSQEQLQQPNLLQTQESQVGSSTTAAAPEIRNRRFPALLFEDDLPVTTTVANEAQIPGTNEQNGTQMKNLGRFKPPRQK